MVQFFIFIFYDFFDDAKSSQQLENKSEKSRENLEEDIESLRQRNGVLMLQVAQTLNDEILLVC